MSIMLLLTIMTALTITVIEMALFTEETVDIQAANQRIRAIEIAPTPAGTSREGSLGNRRMTLGELPETVEIEAKRKNLRQWMVLLELLTIGSLMAALGCAIAESNIYPRMARQFATARETLARSERTRTRFLEVIAHDLRQPIQAIELFSAGLRRRQADPESVSLLDGIQSSLGSMRRMLSGLLDVSRLDAGAVSPERFDVTMGEILEPIAREFAPIARSQGLEFAIIDNATKVNTDPLIVECILRNFVSNAVRYTRMGSVTVTCRATEDGVAVTVSDTGPGIAEAEVERIFQEFYRISATAQTTEGLGLGLAIVRRMASLLNIPVTVSSTIGQGTDFRIVLPPALDEIASTAPPSRRPDVAAEEAPFDAHALMGKRVLLIDDNDQVRRSLGGELTARGMMVTEAASPAAVCTLFKTDPAPSFDIALVDRDLQAQLSGVELLDYLAATFHLAIPAIVLSGTQDFKVIAELQEADYPWLAKPINFDVLLHEMVRMIPRQRAMLASDN